MHEHDPLALLAEMNKEQRLTPFLPNRIRRLFLTADALWAFLKGAVASGSKLQAFRDLQSGLSDSAPYRIWMVPPVDSPAFSAV
jgi:hypothetical protein